VRYDVDRIVREISEAADAFLRPRFRSLESQDVREKSAGEIVTVADEECEAQLGPALRAAVPGSALVGEEATSRDPALIRALSGAAPVWLLDPLDGTSAFVEGSPDYAVMAALVINGVTALSVLHQPEHGRTYVAERGSGAHEVQSGARLSTNSRITPEVLRGSVMKRFLPSGFRRTIEEHESNFESIKSPTVSAGIEYPAIAQGDRDFTMYWRTLPWDHAPGVLLLAESGGMAAHLDGRAYRPAHQRDGLLIAHTPELWDLARLKLGI
jgi:fructose-1,6-bisphosphatase/inositol monophosphatase family enzyme